MELQSHASPPQTLACALAVVVFTVALSARGGCGNGGGGAGRTNADAVAPQVHCEPGVLCRAQTLSSIERFWLHCTFASFGVLCYGR